MTEMIDDELFFETVDLLELAQCHDPRIAHEYVDRRVQCLHLICAFYNRIEVGQLTNQWRCLAINAVTGRLRLFGGSRCADDVCTLRRHGAH